MRGLVPLLLALMLVAGGCRDAANPVVEGDDEGTAEPIEEVVDERCIDPGKDLVTRLVSRLDVPAELEHPRAVESEELEATTFVSARLRGERFEREEPIGTWALAGEEIFSVNAVARELSDWPDGTAEHGLSMEDDGGEESRECVEAAS